MLNKNQKLNLKKRKPKSAQDIQDEIFKKMTVEKKLLLLDDFFKFGKKLQSLNDRVIMGAK